MSCERAHGLETLAVVAGVDRSTLDHAWATAEAQARRARAEPRGRRARAEPPLDPPDSLLIHRVWGESSHGEPTVTTRRALIAALRALEASGKGNPLRLAVLRHLLGEPSAPPPSPFWRALIAGVLPDDLDVDRLNAWDAAELLIAGMDDPRLVARAVEQPEPAARALIARPELARHAELIHGIATDGEQSVRVLIQRSELRRRAELIAAAARDPALAERVLIACPGLDDPRLWDAAMRRWNAPAWAAARQIVADPTEAPEAAWAAVAEHPPAAAYALARVPAARRRGALGDAARSDPQAVGWAVIADPSLLELPAMHAALTGDGWPVAEALIARPELRGRADLIARIAIDPDACWAAEVVIHCPDLRARDDLIRAIAGDPGWAAEVIRACPELRHHPALLTAIADHAFWAAEVVIACPDLRQHPALLARIATDAQRAAEVVVRCPDLRGRAELLARIATDAEWSAWVVRKVGWHPALWLAMPDANRRWWARHYARRAATLTRMARRWPDLTAAERRVLAGLPHMVAPDETMAVMRGETP